MIRLSAVEILSFVVVFGLMCFGLGVIFMQYRRLKESTNHAVRLVGELEADRKKLREDYERDVAEGILERSKDVP